MQAATSNVVLHHHCLHCSIPKHASALVRLKRKSLCGAAQVGMSLGGGQGSAPGAQPHAAELAVLEGSAAQRSIANGAPPPQVPQLLGMSQQPGQPSQHQQHGGSGAPPHSPTPQHRVAIAEARVLAQEAAHLQAQARNFKACLLAPPACSPAWFLSVTSRWLPLAGVRVAKQRILESGSHTIKQCHVSQGALCCCAGACKPPAFREPELCAGALPGAGADAGAHL